MKFTGSTLFISAAYVASLLSVSTASIVSITSPLTNTKYKAGQEAIISWINPTVATIPQIILAKGPSTALQPIITIATNVNANDLKYVWKIPFEIENGNEYAFELGNSPDLAFAGPFTIEGGVGGTLPSSSNTSSTGASSPQPAAANPPAGSNAPAATPAAPSATAGGNSQTSPHNANASTASAANKEMAGQAMVALGLVAAAASQFF
ncbi:hypothetical protein INT46_007809 [Mucor plumbeus]|uniref:Yeast cell wall synthesis Kre9/Knh1-like N-terminal domain-containing protein n=1 Tax=Mucor plumbeus TaxID=97098 RepID=A0A8H7QP13_9FUNG|nr:hypothetical protein INT46_007809 [Mucor plumbeus]